MIPLTIDEAHDLEGQLERELRRKDAKHPALRYYGSTWEAIDAYYVALVGYKFFDDKDFRR